MRKERIFIPVVLTVLCGPRRGEIVALKWGDVDLQGRTLSVVASCEQTASGIRIKEPKSGRSRSVALSATVVAELRAHRARQSEELLRLGIALGPHNFVAGRIDGELMQPTTVTTDWIRIVSASGLPRIRFHDLRHTHASQMLSAGVHPKVASERLGHSTVAITLDLYPHVMPGMQADAAERVDAAIQRAAVLR